MKRRERKRAARDIAGDLLLRLYSLFEVVPALVSAPPTERAAAQVLIDNDEILCVAYGVYRSFRTWQGDDREESIEQITTAVFEDDPDAFEEFCQGRPPTSQPAFQHIYDILRLCAQEIGNNQSDIQAGDWVGQSLQIDLEEHPSLTGL